MHERPLPIIESERLILRLLTETESEAAIKYYGGNQEHLMPYGPKWPDDFLTEDFWIKQIALNLKEFRNDVSARMFLFQKEEPVPIGNVSFAGILRGAAQFCYLGYGLAKDKQGKGIMQEILEPAIQYAFHELNIHRIMANYMPSNERSAKLLKRLGFIIEGHAKNYLFLNGKWEDHVMTSRTNDDWCAHKKTTQQTVSS